MEKLAPGLLIRGEKGDSGAQIALGRFYETQGNIRSARDWFARAARGGKSEAMRLLAINLLTREPVMGDDGVRIIRTAAHFGDAQAAYICGLLAAQDANLANRWNIALACARDAAERGWADAREELALLDGSPFLSAEACIGALTSALPLEEISRTPRIAIVRACLPPEMCDRLMQLGRPRLKRAQVHDPITGQARTEGSRSNSQIEFDIAGSNLIVTMLCARMAATAGLPLTSLEPTAILHYAPGEEFTPHFDWFDAGNPAYAREVAQSGQRVATFLVYLNDDYEGGETEFPKIGLRHMGRKGDGLLFWNVDPSGRPDPMTFHAGRPPARGEKWIVSQWLRGPAAARARPNTL